MTDDPDFYAWLDGELSEPQASAMAARVAAEPELAAFAKQHRALNARLAGAFAPIAEAPVPPRLRAALAAPGAEVIDLAAARERRTGRWSLGGLAIAASLALGLAIGVSLPRGAGDGSFRAEGTAIVAAGPLASALDRQLASAGAVGGTRIGLTFRDGAGRYCRTFTASAQSGLVCRSGDSWAIEGLIRSESAGGDYRMASGTDPALGALVDTRLAGEPLDEAGERKAVASGWR
jgi:anti-sigma factor RsiW